MQGWNLFYPYTYPCIAFSGIIHVSALLIAFFTCNADPACAECDMLETGLYTAVLPDQYCGGRGRYVDQCDAS